MWKDPIVEEIRQHREAHAAKVIHDLDAISAAETPSKLQNLKRRDCIVGDPEDLVHLDWSNGWRP